MPLSAGDKLGPYEILALVGQGGMGEVYRARDARVGREVAIKISQERFTERFDREARVIASLNHPNICQLYDVGPNFLVMELVDGDSPSGPLPLDEALRIARQICDALDYAHEKGVVHRDLKPANIKLTAEGVVKVLDFGLAKHTGAVQESGGQDSPTLSMAATRAGVVLGTAAYMAPEQARGKTVDKRADIWAFGVVLYELLAGQKLFKGEDITETLASVVKEAADLTRVPVKVRPLLQRCLEKDPKKRLRDIADAIPLLELTPETPSLDRSQSGGRWLWPGIAASLSILAAVGFWAPWRKPPLAPQPIRFQIYPPPRTSFAGLVDQQPSVSPDGKQIAFYAMSEDGRARIWVRELDSLESRRLDGTEDPANIVWSPDSRWIAFRSGPEMKKILASGGPVQSLCVCVAILPGAWSKDGVIVFGNSSGLMKVSENGGPVTQLTSVDASRGEEIHFQPSFLPDGKRFLYVRVSRVPDKQGTYAGSIDDKPGQQPSSRILAEAARYASGRLVFKRGAALMAQRFDADSLMLSGEAAQVADSGAISWGGIASGVLAFGGVGAPYQLTWFDRLGKALGTVGDPGPLASPRISPDGLTIAFNRYDTGPNDVWLSEPKRGAYRFTFGEDRENPVWSPDGSHLAYSLLAGGGWSLVQKAASGVGNEEQLYKGDLAMAPFEWSRDNKYVLFVVLDPKTKMDTWVLPLTGDKKVFPYLNNEYNEDAPRLSPDGRWVAYHSDRSGRYEVWVDTFTGLPAGASAARGSWPVSTNGGTRPVWSRDGKELFFISADRKLMVAEVSNSGGSKFEFTTPKALFEARISGSLFDLFDVSKDGRFLMPVPLPQTSPTPITVVVNWTAGLK